MAQVIHDPSTLNDLGSPPLVVQLRPVLDLTDDQLYEFAQINRELRIERTARGELVIMPPAGGETGRSNIKIAFQLEHWSSKDGSGVAFDSSTGFRLPNKAMRSPDACWVRKSRWESLSPEDRRKFAPVCPDFVIELRSETDSLRVLREKMQEYADNGVRLGWLIDPVKQRVEIYRPGQAPTIVEAPTQLAADPELPGFTLDLTTIW